MAPGYPPQTRAIDRSPEAALRGIIVPAPLAGEGQEEGGYVSNSEHLNLFRI
jgi:hypothetical protein